MEFIYSLPDGRKAVIYDEGNNVMLLFITNIRNMQSTVIARDYLSQLDCKYFRNNLYITYISTGNEVKWKQIGKDDALILIAGTGEVFDVSMLSMFALNEKLYVSYEIYNSGSKTYEIRYINPNGDRRFEILVSANGKINDYKFLTVDEEIYLKIRYEDNKEYEYQRLYVDGQGKVTHSREYLVDEKKEKEYKLEMEKNNEHFKTEIEKLKQDLQKRHSDEIKALEENYTRQYSELSEMTRQVQEEGRRYRDLYIQTLDVINKKNENKKEESLKKDSESDADC